MTLPDLGSLERVRLQKVWPNEERDFTPWLAKNLGILGDELGMSLELVECEARVGPYEADLVCRDTNDGAMVVVENQLGQTDHDHLGKALTYAAHFDAQAVVWVARTFTEQHRQAMDWLNDVSKDGTRFFALEIGLWKIGDSATAPRFDVVARPGDTGIIVPPDLSPLQRMRLEFWEGFAKFVFRNGDVLRKTHAPRPNYWLGMRGVGRGGFFLHGIVSTGSESGGHELRAELQIKGSHSDHYFNLLKSHQSDIEGRHDFDEHLVWHNPDGVQQRRIYWRLSTNFDDPDKRTDQYRWLLERIEALHNILAPRIQSLQAPE